MQRTHGGRTAPPTVRLLLVVLTLASAAAGQYWLSVYHVPARCAAAWGVAAIGFVLLCRFGINANDLPTQRYGLSRRVEWLFLAGVFGVGICFGLYHFREFPPGLNHDAAWEGLYALRILRGEAYTPYASEAWGRETLTLYLRTVSIWLMGPTVLAVVLPSMIAGMLALPFFYAWARAMFGARLALMATWLFGVSGWHLVFSRIGWRSDFQPLFTAITCCFFIRGLQTQRGRDFALSGMGLALALNTYNAARALPLLFGLWVIIQIFQSGYQWLRRYARGLGVMAVTFAVAVIPLAMYAVNNWAAFQVRAAFLAGKDPWWPAVKSTLLLFNFWGNGDDFFVNTPALEYPTAVFLPFGVLWCVAQWRDQRAQFLLIGLAVGILPGLITRPNLNHDVGAMPFIFFFIALGVLFFGQQIGILRAPAGRVAAAILMSSVGLAATTATYSQYLGAHPRLVWGFYPEATILGEYVKTLVPRYEIYIGDTPYLPRDTITYMSYQGEGDPERRNYVWVDDISVLLMQPITSSPGKGLAFIFQNSMKGRTVRMGLALRYPKYETVELRYGGRAFATALLIPPGGTGVSDATSPTPTPASSTPTPTLAAMETAAPVGTLSQPRGVALRRNGSIEVCDFGNDRLQEFGLDLHGRRQIGGPGSTAGRFKQPCAVAVGPDDELFVADTWNHRVQVLSQRGDFVREWTAHLYAPRGIAVNIDGDVFVADTGNHRIVRFSSTGQQQAQWGAKGSAPGQFVNPVGIAIDAEGRIYVCDNGNSRLQIFTSDGQFVGAFPVLGWEVRAFSEPYVAVDAKGTIWVTVPSAGEIRGYTRSGELLRTLTAQNVPGVTFSIPMGIAYDQRNHALIVSDLANRLVRIPLSQP